MENTMTPRPGRPPKSGGRATLNVMIRVRVLRVEQINWKRAAKKLGKQLSEWLRDLANAAAKE